VEGSSISVEPASFEQHGNQYKPREVKRLDKLDKMRLQAREKREGAWDESEIPDVGLKIVIIEHFYTMEEIEAAQDVEQLLAEIEGELREEIEASVGRVARMEVFEETPTCKVKFESALDAERCVQLMEGRWFDKRQLRCYFWDGKTDYKLESAET
jgi:HIV Tat-specific factor 1